ncbi:hypothetical protein BJ742DRAFT_352380 [Cladochytrium replicatum]|nr:hypothetical protein BJ742DRAFT_352380 [Cladochytrium replicatum]
MRGPHKNKAAHEQIARQVTSLMKNIENGTDEVNGSIPIKTDDVGSEDVHTVPKERAGPNRRERRRMMREQKDANNESIAEGSSADVPMVDGSTNDMATSVDTNSNSMNTDEIGEDIDPQCHTAESSASHRRRPRKRGGVKKKRSKPFPLQHDDADVDGEDVPDRSSSQAGNTGEDTTMDELCGSMKQLEIPSSVRFGGASKMFVNLRDGGPQPHGGRPWNFGSVKTLYMETSRKQRGNEV